MKKIYNNLEKIVCFGLAAGLVLGVSVLAGMSSAQIKDIETKLEGLSKYERSGKTDCADGFSFNFAEYSEIDLSEAKRNIFAPYKMDDKTETLVSPGISKTPVIEVLDISYRPLGLQYQGRIVYPDGRVVAQVNTEKKSYLVELGDKLRDYTVSHLDKKMIELKNNKGESLKIKYLQTAFSDELMAKIRENLSGNIQIVYPKSSFYGYKVLDIETDSVILSDQGEHLRLQKGMVHKQ